MLYNYFIATENNNSLGVTKNYVYPMNRGKYPNAYYLMNDKAEIHIIDITKEEGTFLINLPHSLLHYLPFESGKIFIPIWKQEQSDNFLQWCEKNNFCWRDKKEATAIEYSKAWRALNFCGFTYEDGSIMIDTLEDEDLNCLIIDYDNFKYMIKEEMINV